ncbi:MAG: glycosyltransferase family 4 protein [Campylobacterota bacterium]|nr:glycosyltransferase family 4 protein [Campylobacterota bacterium]
MKILLISNMYPSKESPFFGIFVKNFKNQLEQKEVTFTLVVVEGRGISKIEKIQKYFKFFIDVRSEIKKNDYDVIYVHYISHSLIPLLFVKLFSNKPLILNAHGSDVLVNNKMGKFIQKLVIPIIKKANLLVVPSEYFKDIIYHKFSINKEKIFVSPSGGINTQFFKPQNITKNIFTIGYVSRIDKGKGWDILLDAISLLKAKGFTFKVLMIGGGVEEKLLLQKIEELKLENIVNFVGPKPHNELVSYFNQMNIFAFTTTRLSESLGLVGLEAMACAVPVVGSNIGGLPGYIDDGINGALFESSNYHELSKHLEYFMNLDSDEIRKYQVNALETAKKYDSEKVTQELLSSIEKAINEKI